MESIHDASGSQMELQQLFDEIVMLIRETPVTPELHTSDDERLRMYGLYKHITSGPCDGKDPPSIFNVVARAKYNAWAQCRGQTEQQAQLAYVELAASHDNWLSHKCRDMLNQFKEKRSTPTTESCDTLKAPAQMPASARAVSSIAQDKQSHSRVAGFLEKHLGITPLIPRGQLDISYLDLAFAAGQCLRPGASSLHRYAQLERKVAQRWLKHSRQRRNATDGEESVLVGLSVRSLLDLYVTSRAYPPDSEMVVVPPINIPGMMDVLIFHNLKIVAVDIPSSPEGSMDIRVDVDAVANAITDKTVAVMVVHPFGTIWTTQDDMQRLRELAQVRNFDIIEDCAECYTGLEPDAYLGSPCADVSLFSFGTIKTATALGGGVAVLRRNEGALCGQLTRIQNTLYRQQTTSEYLWKVVLFMIAKFVSDHPMLYGVIAQCCHCFGINFDRLVVSVTRAFVGHASGLSEKRDPHRVNDIRRCNLMMQIRRRPSVPLLSLLNRRLSQHETTANAVRLRIARCRQMSELLQDASSHVATLREQQCGAQNLYWLYPIKVMDPEKVCRFLRGNGFDVTRGTSQLGCVSSRVGDCPNTDQLFGGILYLPVASRLSSINEMKRIASLLHFGTQGSVSKTVSEASLAAGGGTKAALPMTRLIGFKSFILIVLVFWDAYSFRCRFLRLALLTSFAVLPAVAFALRLCIANFYIESSKAFAKYNFMLQTKGGVQESPPTRSHLENGHNQSRLLSCMPALSVPQVSLPIQNDTTPEEFLQDRRVFLTGATGFLGSLLLRDILLNRGRLAIPAGVVVLCRSKHKKSAATRVSELLDDPMFSFLSSDEKAALVVVVEGDVALPNLGMSSDDMSLVCNEMNISHVFHCAASVSFTQSLHDAAITNISSSLKLQSLTKKLKNVSAKYVYISTAFVHGATTGTSSQPLSEELYPLHPYDPVELYQSMMETESYASTAMHSLGFPNTYTFSKCVCEHLLLRNRGVNTIIIRPSIIGPAVQEPHEGWAGSKPSTIVAAACLYLSYQWNLWSFGKQRVPFIPVDVVSRFVLSKAFCDGNSENGDRKAVDSNPNSSSLSSDDEFERISNWSGSSFGSESVRPAGGIATENEGYEASTIHNAAFDSSSPNSASFCWIDYAVAVTHVGSVNGYFQRTTAYVGLFFTVKLVPYMEMSIETYERIHYLFVSLPVATILAFFRWMRWTPKVIQRLSKLSVVLDLPLLFFPFMNKTFAFQSDLALPDNFSGERYMFTCVAAAERFISRMRSSEAPRKGRFHGSMRDSVAVVGGQSQSPPPSDLWWACTQPRGNCVIRIAAWCFIKILRMVADEVTVDVASFCRLAQAFHDIKKESNGETADGLHIILAPTHRSFFDFLLISYVLFSLPELGIVLPYIAASEEFGRLPILGLFARFAGAFFLKRGVGSADPSLQVKITSLKAREVSKGTACFEVFIEGQRSRDRRFVSPKTGFLRCLTDTGGNHLVVPITINYERIPEQSSLVLEAQEGKRPTLSNLKLIHWLKRVASNEVNLGRIHVVASPPIQMNASTTSKVTKVAHEIQTRQKDKVYISDFHIRAASIVLDLNFERVRRALVAIGCNLWPGSLSYTLRDDDPTGMLEESVLWTAALQFGHHLAPLFLTSHPSWCRWLSPSPVEPVQPKDYRDNLDVCAVKHSLSTMFDKADAAVDSALQLLTSKGFANPTGTHLFQFACYQNSEVPSIFLRSAACMRVSSESDAGPLLEEASLSRLSEQNSVAHHPHLNLKDLEALGSWGFKDSCFVLSTSRDGSRSVTMNGERYDICGKRLSNLIPFIERETKVPIVNMKTALPLTVAEPPNTSCDLSAEDLDALEEAVSRVSVHALDRARNGFGHSQADIFCLRSGSFFHMRIPDAVAWPSCESEVMRLAELAVDKNWCLIPCGGGTNVSNATRCPCKEVEPRPIISLDMKLMNKVLWINEEDCLAHVEGGIVGRDLVRELEKRGYTIGHEPDSIEFSTLGGWIATKASGMKRNKYGNIEDIVKAVRVAGSKGILWQDSGSEHGAFGRESRGIDLCSLIIGSEGCFGVVTSAVVRIWPLSDCRQFESVILPDLEHGLRFVRDIAKLGQSMPASVRLLDNDHFRLGQALVDDSSILKTVMQNISRMAMRVATSFSSDSVVCATIAYEGSKCEVSQQRQAVKRLCTLNGGVLAGSRTGRAGYELTFVIAYLRDFALTHYLLSESFETFAPWSKLEVIISATKRRIRDEHKKRCLPGSPFIGCRVTQLYHEGACLYFYFCMNYENVKNPSSVFAEIEHCARNEILERGGSLSHHHGIGKLRAPFLSEMDSSPLQDLRQSLKETVDPKNIFGAGNGPYFQG